MVVAVGTAIRKEYNIDTVKRSRIMLTFVIFYDYLDIYNTDICVYIYTGYIYAFLN